MTFLFLPGPPGLHFHFLVDLSTLTVCPLYFTSLSSCSQLFCFCFFWLIFFPSFALQSSVSPIWIRCNSQSCCPRTLRERKGTFYPICSISATPHNGRRLHSLYVMDVLSIFAPHVGHVGGVGHRLALQQCILGHVEGGAFGRDDNDWRTWWEAGHKRHHICSQKWLQLTISEYMIIQCFTLLTDNSGSSQNRLFYSKRWWLTWKKVKKKK